ncbi:MAG TPA: acyl-CoA dehydrogenase family protein [Rhodanobacteraceae bacterium]|nr:acyl-CoA dehydrogenase family protein [Rhodanobacteraceae bacterium]
MNDREQRHAELARRYLPDACLKRFHRRAATYDRNNQFFTQDLAELRRAGYLTMLVPARWGGADVTINQAARLQQRLAGAAPATALAINMHLLCLAMVRVMVDRGDESLAYVFDEAMAGEIFALGVSEPANDWVLQGSTTTATPQHDGGYRLSGVKIFTSLGPVWTRLLVHGLDASHAGRPRLVYGFIERTRAVSRTGKWDVLGMRATQSHATALKDAPLRAERVARRIRPGRTPDLLTFAITANFQLLIGSVYAGIAQRALALAVEALKHRRSARYAATLDRVPEYRVRVADALRTLQPVLAELDLCTRDLDEGVDHGKAWPLKLVSARLDASTVARRMVELAMGCAGGASYARDSELARLHRDATASLFHPPGADAARALYASALLDDG